MTWVKVCGLSRPEDVVAAADAGADAVGFVFYEPSPRAITAGEARRLGEGFPGLTVAVTVDLDAGSLLALATEAGVGGVQPHGAHAAEAARAARARGLAVLRPVAVDGPVDLDGIEDDEVPLLDSDVLGGTGRPFEWSWIRDLGRPYVLAGGLHPGNVAEAVAQLAPWGVDASSGLESAPGIKDPEKVAAFVREARR